MGVAQRDRAEARHKGAQALVEAAFLVVDGRLELDGKAEMAEPEVHAQRARAPAVVSLEARGVVRNDDARGIGGAGEPSRDRRARVALEPDKGDMDGRAVWLRS